MKTQNEQETRNKGKTVRYYLKDSQIDFINNISLNQDISPSEALRDIINTYGAISNYFIKLKEVEDIK